MNRNSLFFILNIFFILTIISINSLLLWQYYLKQEQDSFNQLRRYHKAGEALNKLRKKGITLSMINPYLIPYSMKVTDKPLIEINSGQLLEQTTFYELYNYQKKNYFCILTRDKKWIILEDTKPKQQHYFWLFFIAVNTVLTSFYLLLSYKLKPLKILKNNIALFSKGRLDIDTTIEGKDEIAEISHEFNKTIEKIKTLQESRNLMLRNIMHELKTPITKGQLTTEMLEESKNKQRLSNAFLRLNYLLNEFSIVDKLTSSLIKLNPKEYRIVDILDHAMDILMISHDQITIHPQDVTIKVDFELFAIAIKNLLDNALKYGKNKPEIHISQQNISIISTADPLKQPLESYLKPFNRTYENAHKGLGLGLYITYHILKAHEYTLSYKHIDNKNIFVIQFD